jgi:AraC-like DNA-binding protein
VKKAPDPVATDPDRTQPQHRTERHVTRVSEAGDYTRSVRGVDIEVVQTGRGAAATRIVSDAGNDWVATSLKLGFPVLSRTALSDDVVGVAAVRKAPPGARWCGSDVESGDVLVYGPGAEHVAVNPAGMEFAFAILPTSELHRSAVSLRRTPELGPGSVQRLAPSEATEVLRVTLVSITEDPLALGAGMSLYGSDLLDKVVCALTERSPSRLLPMPRRLDDRRVVLACIEFVEAVERIPTLSELCQVAAVSERRLRQAFVALQDAPPHQFFIAWGLDRARRRLLDADPSWETVARVAAESGFNHLGRFARRYRRQFGEVPSTTLRRAPSIAGLG